MKNILISNDDGVLAPGLMALAEALSTIAKITVVAPDRDRSGASNSLSLDNPLRLRQLGNGFFSVEGTPTDCVHLALTGILPQKPDLVVSGINAGANLGDDVLYSGTVAAAMEGRFLGLPAVAISLAGGHTPKYYSTAAEVAKRLVMRLTNGELAAKTILNVNVPDIPFADIRAFRATRLGTRHLAENIIPAKDPRGKTIYWIGASGSEQDAGPGTDFYALTQNEVSITPLQLDLTHYAQLEHLTTWASDIDLSDLKS